MEKIVAYDRMTEQYFTGKYRIILVDGKAVHVPILSMNKKRIKSYASEGRAKKFCELQQKRFPGAFDFVVERLIK